MNDGSVQLIMSSLIFCLLDLLITDRGIWKSPAIIVDLSSSPSSSISFSTCILTHCIVRCMHIKDCYVFLENRPCYHHIMPVFILFFFNLFIYLYLFLAVLGFCFCVRAFSSCSKRGPLFIAVHGPFTVPASPVAEHRLQTHRLSSCGSRAQSLHGMWDLPRPGLEPMSPALAGRFLTTAPPGKPACLYS